ncbi:Hypothetical predicted protein [Marmota monax]|uniref:Uncharacterized protein n=1 Tax=Marmota monax TaxID=9995 RepID=A0A5E4CJ10_MARMO|nr:Hypothetical predicted protein [Marmota monax]
MPHLARSSVKAWLWSHLLPPSRPLGVVSHCSSAFAFWNDPNPLSSGSPGTSHSHCGTSQGDLWTLLQESPPSRHSLSTDQAEPTFSHQLSSSGAPGGSCQRPAPSPDPPGTQSCTFPTSSADIN